MSALVIITSKETKTEDIVSKPCADAKEAGNIRLRAEIAELRKPHAQANQ